MVNLRAMIDEIDRKMIQLIKARQEVSLQIGLFKKEHQLPIFDPSREKEHLETLKALALKEGLDPTHVVELFSLLMQHSKDTQENL